jgi:hypothetical protein
MGVIEREEVVRFLAERGATRIRHHHRSLADHLEGTERLLADWGCDDTVQAAGLCHAAYGTDGLIAPLVELSERHTLRGLIGPAAEAAVYRYASCDRRFVYPQLGLVDTVRWRDRFTGEEFEVDPGDLATFVLLTWANALEAASAEADVDRSAVRDLLVMTGDLAGPAPHRTATDVLGVEFG